MNNFILTIDEIKTMERIKRSVIPLQIKYFYFKYLPAIELINSQITEILLKRNRITQEFYNQANAEIAELQNAVQPDKLDEASRNYYLDLMKIFMIFKKHHAPQK